jgi:spore coat protein A, manganese oxidase
MRRGSLSRSRKLRAIVAGAALASIAGAGGLGMVATAAPPPPPQDPSAPLTRFVDPLPIPPRVGVADGETVNLTLQQGEHSFSPGNDLPATTTWGYGIGAATMAYLGPTIETRRDDSITVRAANQLGAHPARLWCPPESPGCDPVGGAIDMGDPPIHGVEASDVTAPRAAVHKHGGHVLPRSDGGPLDTFKPGSYWTYTYDNDQEGTTLWYHDHALGITRLNVVAGLAGFYLLRDDYDTGTASNPVGLPAGSYEIPLAIQDRILRADGSVDYPPGPDRTWAPEYFGDVAVVNGRAFPFHEVQQGVYRLRLLNGSNARFYNLGLADRGGKVRMYQIGSDGGLLNAPVPVRQLLLAPGERADVLIDFTRARAGERIVVTNDARAPFPGGPRSIRLGAVPLPEIMQFRVTGDRLGTGARTTVPATLRGGTDQPLAIPTLPTTGPDVARERTIFLNEILDPVTGVPTEVLMNNLNFHALEEGHGDPRLQENPQRDTLEVWHIVNASADTHPIHLHLVQFQLAQRQKLNSPRYLEAVNAQLRAAGKIDQACPGLPDPCAAGEGPPYMADGTRVEPPPFAPFLRGNPMRPPANEAGWKDTIQANPGEVTTIVVPFGGATLSSQLFPDQPNRLPYTDSPQGDYVFHCHILEHEDNDMMLPYTVGPLRP